MQNDLKLGCQYAGELFPRLALDFTAKLSGDPAPTSLIIDDQAVIFMDHEAGGLRLHVYPVRLTLLQIRKMFGVASEEDQKPPTPNRVPVENIFDAVQRAVRALVALRLDRAIADLANGDRYRTDVDVVSHIPERARVMDVDPSKALALPGFNIESAPRLMRDYIAREDWTGSFPCFAIRSDIPIAIRDADAGRMGERERKGESFYLRTGHLPVSGDPRTNHCMERLSRNVAKMSADGSYDVWLLVFKPGNESITRLFDLTEKEFNYYFVRELTDDTETDISVNLISEYGFRSRAKDARASVGSLTALVADDFTDTVKLPSGFRTSHKNGEALYLTVAPTALSATNRIVLFRLKDGSVLRILLSAYANAVEKAGQIIDLPGRLWDGKSGWKDHALAVSIREDAQHNGPYIHIDSGFPELDGRLSALELNSDILRKFLPSRKRLAV
jgi:hypothetical protein